MEYARMHASKVSLARNAGREAHWAESGLGRRFRTWLLRGVRPSCVVSDGRGHDVLIFNVQPGRYEMDARCNDLHVQKPELVKLARLVGRSVKGGAC